MPLVTKLALAGAALTVASAARADITLDEYGPGHTRAPTQQITEAACDLDVDLRGAVATITQTQRLTNPSSGPGPYSLAAIYEFDLPPGATVTKFASGKEQALPVAARSATANVADRPMLAPDPAILVARPRGSMAQYAIYVQPFTADTQITLTTTYTALATIDRGALQLRLPGRPVAGKLTACRGKLHAVAGPGAKIGKLTATQGLTPATTTGAVFTLDAEDVTLAAELTFTGKDPVVWTQSQPLADGLTASLVTVAAPLAGSGAAPHERALFVIDSSRSIELVGKTRISKVMGAVAAALPPGAEMDAVIYDRTATRALGTWQPATPATVFSIEKQLLLRVPTNGSDLVGALAAAHTAITDGKKDATLVVVIGDGVLGDVSGQDLTRALDAQTSAVDVLSVVIDPAKTRTPGAEALRALINKYGGSAIEVSTDELDGALAAVTAWMRPSWVELALGDLEIPASVGAGGGFTRTLLHRGAFTSALSGHGTATFRIAPRAAPAAPVATLALAAAETTSDDFDPDTVAIDAPAKPTSNARYPYVHADLAFAVLSRTGKVGTARLAMVRGGGPYERVVAINDPSDAAINAKPAKVSVAAPPPSAISKITLERLFRDQLQPKAYACYQRALGRNNSLAGTVHFTFFLGRGEVAQVQVAGLNEPALDACLLDAAYQLTVPAPDFTLNADDQTIAHYPLTFAVAENKPVIVLGDADSSSPVDIDAIQGGPPDKGRKVNVDASTPLGKLRPTK